MLGPHLRPTLFIYFLDNSSQVLRIIPICGLVQWPYIPALNVNPEDSFAELTLRLKLGRFIFASGCTHAQEGWSILVTLTSYGFMGSGKPRNRRPASGTMSGVMGLREVYQSLFTTPKPHEEGSPETGFPSILASRCV